MLGGQLSHAAARAELPGQSIHETVLDGQFGVAAIANEIAASLSMMREPSAARRLARHGRLLGPFKANPQMLSTINSTNPMPANSTARATKSYSSQCRESESITFIPVRAPFFNLLIKMYRTPVSGVFRPQSFWFRGLWQKPGQRFAVCGRNPAGQFLQEEHDEDQRMCAGSA